MIGRNEQRASSLHDEDGSAVSPGRTTGWGTNTARTAKGKRSKAARGRTPRAHARSCNAPIRSTSGRRETRLEEGRLQEADVLVPAQDGREPIGHEVNDLHPERRAVHEEVAALVEDSVLPVERIRSLLAAAATKTAHTGHESTDGAPLHRTRVSPGIAAHQRPRPRSAHRGARDGLGLVEIAPLPAGDQPYLAGPAVERKAKTRGGPDEQQKKSRERQERAIPPGPSQHQGGRAAESLVYNGRGKRYGSSTSLFYGTRPRRIVNILGGALRFSPAPQNQTGAKSPPLRSQTPCLGAIIVFIRAPSKARWGGRH